MPNRIKVSCDSCGLLMRVDQSQILPPCEECGGRLVPIDAPEGGETDALAHFTHNLVAILI